MCLCVWMCAVDTNQYILSEMSFLAVLQLQIIFNFVVSVVEDQYP